MIISSAAYTYRFLGAPRTVYRGCDRQTGRDRVLMITDIPRSAQPPDTTLDLIAIDRTWVMFAETHTTTLGFGSGPVIAVDVVSGRQATATNASERRDGPVVTDRGVIAWITEPAAVYASVNGKEVLLDRGGTLTDLHAEGDAIVWTHDGVRRTYSQWFDGE